MKRSMRAFLALLISCVVTLIAGTAWAVTENRAAILASAENVAPARVVVNIIPDSINVNEFTQASGTPYRVDGRKAGTSRLIWSTSPLGCVTVQLLDGNLGQSVRLTAKIPSICTVTARWNRVGSYSVIGFDVLVIKSGTSTTPAPPIPTPTPLPTDPPPVVIDTNTTHVGGSAQLPTTFTTTYPTMTGIVRSVGVGGDLQAALDAANPGDVIELAAGATYSGNFTWTYKGSCTNTTVIRTAGPDGNFPPFGTRVRPSTATNYAKIVTPNVGYALFMKNSACKLWVSRVEITGTPQGGGVNYQYGLVRIGEDETSTAAQPADITLDRVYIHGTTSPLLHVQHGVVFNGVRNAIIDSWVSDIHWPGTETHAVAGWAGAGPFKIVNNHLSAASIGFLYGGANPTVAAIHPADFEIRKNHFYRSLAEYAGKGYAVKNLLELKHALRVLVEDNVFDGSWADAQAGYAINMLSGGDSHPPGALAQVADVTFRYNIVKNAPIGFTLAANPYQQATPVTRVTIEHNLFENIGPYGPVDSESKGIQLLDNLSNLRVAHNTIVRTATTGITFIAARDASVPLAANIVIIDNLAGGNSPYGVPFGTGIGNDALNDWAGGTWQFSKNVLWNSNVAAPDDPRAPAGNFWPTTQSAVGFGTGWALSASSPYLNKASDGTNPGANMTTVTTRTTGVVVAP